MTDNNTIAINYSDEKLRILVEEYITQQRSTFSLKGVCSYVLYWAMEDGHTATTGPFKSNQLAQTDADRIKSVLKTIVCEGRIAKDADNYQVLNS